jgi:hypothetical protein
MQDKSWTDTLADDDVKLLQDVEVMSDNLISQVYIFIDLFHQYIDLIQSAAIFSPDYKEPSAQDAKVYPTQTSSQFPNPKDGGPSNPDETKNMNREQRRAAVKKKLPFDVIQTPPKDDIKND